MGVEQACMWPSTCPDPLSLRRRPPSPLRSRRTRAGLGSVNATDRRWGSAGTFPQERVLLAACASSPAGPKTPDVPRAPCDHSPASLTAEDTSGSGGQTLRLTAPPGTRGNSGGSHRSGGRGLSASRGRCGTRLLPSRASLREQGWSAGSLLSVKPDLWPQPCTEVRAVLGGLRRGFFLEATVDGGEGPRGLEMM